MVTIIKVFGWLIAKTPQFIPQCLIALCLRVFFAFSPEKLRIAESNLHHTFPEKNIDWIKANARKSILQLAETSLFSLIIPFIKGKNLHKYLSVGPESIAALNKALDSDHPLILACPHMGCWEALTITPALVDYRGRKLTSLYRPLRNKKLDTWVKRSRERHGYEMLSRRHGLNTVLKTLRNKGVVGLLFDQHTLGQGALISFINRSAAATPLPGILATKFDCRIITMTTERTKFWSYKAHIEFHDIDPKTTDATVFVNQWLENKLLSDPDKACSWLWAHRRWKVHYDVYAQFHRKTKTSLLSHYDKAPKGHRLLIVLPESSQLQSTALSLIPHILTSRPCTEITLLSHTPIAPPLPEETTNLSLKNSQQNYTQFSQQIRNSYYDLILVLDESPFWDRLLKQAGCKYTVGLKRPNTPHRKALRYTWESPHSSPPQDQFSEWIDLLKRFGLQESTQDSHPQKTTNPQ